MKKVYKLSDEEVAAIVALVIDTFTDNADKFFMIKEDMAAVIADEILFGLRSDLQDMELGVS